MKARFVAVTAVALVVIAVVAVVAAACGGTGAPSSPTPVVRALADGEVLGKVERGASGDILTLVGISCDNGKLIVRMGSKTVTGVMDCKDAPPQALVERVLSKQVTVTYANGKVHVESTNGELVEVPATSVMITESNATPES